MKIKHNKKRNTAFVFESLMREATVAILKGDDKRKNTVLKIVKRHFKPDSELKKHFQCYKSLYENQEIDRHTSEKILREAKIAMRLIDLNGLFKQQSDLIGDINKDLTPAVFGNFVPNYKTLATIDQIFSDKTSPKNRVMLEGTIVDNMTKSPISEGSDVIIDDLTVRFFTDKFNEKYTDTLTEEQKQLLSYYITSFTDNAVGLKSFLNEEIARLKGTLERSTSDNIFAVDTEMTRKANQIVEKLDSFKKTEINDNVLLTVLKTQELVKELDNGSDH
tara:strand:+ start:7471 stop:8301 length:831 start_codon:yes stop_codon:yes gene_type:complete